MSINKWLNIHTSSLSGKTVAVTGSTGGLGRELCAYLASLDASLILVDRSKARSEKHAEELREKYGGSVSLVSCDLSDISSVISAAEELTKAEPDILIHNAGAYSIPREICTTGYGNVFQINFLSPYYMTKVLLPTLRRKKGRVIAVGSIAHNYSKTDGGDIDFKTRNASSKVYGNAKRFLMFSLYSLFENETDVKLSVVHPGITFTNITAHYPKIIFAVIKHPMKVIFMKPKKAALSLLKGAFEDTEKNTWIGPRVFNIWGYPSKKPLKTCSDEEAALIFREAEAAHLKMQVLD